MLGVLYVVKYHLLYLIDDAIESMHLRKFHLITMKGTPGVKPGLVPSAVECSTTELYPPPDSCVII